MKTLNKESALYALIENGFNVQIIDEQEYILTFSVSKSNMVIELLANSSDCFNFESTEDLINHLNSEFKYLKKIA